MRRIIGFIMFVIPYYLIIKNTIESANREHIIKDLQLAFAVLAIVSVYFGLAGFLLFGR